MLPGRPGVAHVDPSYPRPDFDRSQCWHSLDGQWEFRADAADRGLTEHWPDDLTPWPESVRVPGPWELSTTGLNRHWLPVGWYRRRFVVPTDWPVERLVLHFGAVFHDTTVWVDGQLVIHHVGGYSPFEADITEHIGRARTATLTVRVMAPTDKRHIPHGKQRSIPADDYDGCSFTPTSGIWQSVWIEGRPASYIDHVRLTPSPNLDGIDAVVILGGDVPAGLLRITIDGHQPVTIEAAKSRLALTLPISEPRLWSPADPQLYWIEFRFDGPNGTDTVRSYTGLRRLDWTGGQLRLNGEPLYLRGVLDQGYWPGTGLVPPSADALRADVEIAAESGFNLVRKHMKLEDPRWLYWTDVLGMMVWAEPPSPGRFSAASTEAFRQVTAEMITRDYNHPSIVIWGAYNEEWGLDWQSDTDPRRQHAVADAYQQIRDLDQSRPIVDDSGWSHVRTDLLDWHYYDQSPAGFASVIDPLLSRQSNQLPIEFSAGVFTKKPLVITAAADTGQPLLNSEYGGGWTSLQRGWHLRWQTQELRRHRSNIGYVYTELYDIEHETVGIYDANRSVKDLGGTVPADVHADTVLIPLLEPQSAGIDIRINSEFEMSLQIAHHGPMVPEAQLSWFWDHENARLARVSVSLPKNDVTDPVTIAVPAPLTPGRQRLRLVLATTAGRQLAATFVDAEFELAGDSS
jgi:beta-galactosidase/beta-glucuronidase